MSPRALALPLLLWTAAAAGAAPFAERAEVRAWLDEVAARHALDAARLRALVAAARHRPEVIAHARRPAESLPWREYRRIFLTAARIRAGRAWLAAHAAPLARARAETGVPPEIVAAIVGVESDYGGNTGTHPTLDTLLTLGFDYPPRAAFFRGQLEQLLLLEREAGLDLRSLRGSWAGALGQGQFIPSSYRDFAVDGDGDGRIDLWRSPPDIIASVANYFRRHRWRPDAPVARRIAAGVEPPLSAGLEPDLEPAALRAAGVRLDCAPPAGERLAVHAFEADAGREYWLAFHNFYVITRYNHSALYALAVHQLAAALREAADA